jgi:hypothetical protein
MSERRMRRALNECRRVSPVSQLSDTDRKMRFDRRESHHGNVMVGDWLGGRDSNPDNVVQSHVSYRWTTSQYRLLRDEG